MYIKIEDLKEKFPNTISLQEYATSEKTRYVDSPYIILRNYNEPTTPPYLESKVFDFKEHNYSPHKLANSFGTKPNVPGINVINAIIAALGSGDYKLHISDGSYTGDSIFEIKEFMKNFDNTDLKVWIPEVFDCDDFSEVLQGNINGFFPGISFGTIWYGPKDPPFNWGHSVNIFYDYESNKVWLVEPQNDVFYEFNKEKWKAWMVIL